MGNEQEDITEELPLDSVGALLRRERERHDLSLDHVTAETRIPKRHLEVIESGNFSALPARTYAIGFSRSYARLLGLDEFEIADQVRAELAGADAERELTPAGMAPGDSTKLPSSRFAWVATLSAILLTAGLVSFYTTFYAAGTGPDALVDEDAAQIADAQGQGEGASTAASAEITGAQGQVVFTALEEGVWVKFYDVAGEQLLQKQMASGERFEIPSDAQGPQIWTGRPDAFAITIDGRSVPKLAEDDFIMRDVAISAEALLGRAAPVSTGSNPASAPSPVNN
ncbi:MAG: RodZ domain-containing protein [Erythrobacter sp.]|uniref:RodZ domain-containing protein n=1 Tax=Marinobacter alexandrii TaxID=2570351 RepID=UPI0032997628